MRPVLLAAAILLSLFEVVHAQGKNAPALDFLATPQTDRLGSQMIGLEVYDNRNQDLARIEDIAVGKDGHIQAFILSVGEDLGLVAHFVAVKPSALTFLPSEAGSQLQAHMDATTAQLQAAPEYHYTGIRKACLRILGN
jgi:hypothetical protein